MAAGSWFSGVINSTVQTVVQLPFCKNDVICKNILQSFLLCNSGCCEVGLCWHFRQWIRKAFGHNSVPIDAITLDCHLLFINYFQHSQDSLLWGKMKAFFTCSSQLTGSCVLWYHPLHALENPSLKRNLIQTTWMLLTNLHLCSVSVGYVTPMMNLFSYSLRNKDVKKL